MTTTADPAADASAGDARSWLADRRAEIDALLDARVPALPADEDPGRLVEAIRYSLLAPGKRLRPALALAAAEAVGSRLDDGVRLAAASVELVHCYSLVHDDLPAMDDDDERRGKPTNHRVFGEATTILVGDALLTMAFEWLAEAGRAAGPDAAGRYLGASWALARGAGPGGMVRGQARDLGEAAPQTLAAVERLAQEKTAALFRAALEVGAAAAGAGEIQTLALGRFGECFGVAFQHADDLADGDHGEHAAVARERLGQLVDEAVAALDGFGPRAWHLAALARGLTIGAP